MKIKKQKILITISTIIIIVVILCSIFITPQEKEKLDLDNEKLNKMCNEINEEIKNQSNFVVFVTDNLVFSGDSNDVVNEYINAHQTSNQIFNIDFTEINDKCIKKILENDNLYEFLDTSRVNTVLGYKKGKIVMTQSNMTDYISLEEDLDKYGVIKAKKKKESVTLEKFKDNINQEKYIFLMITEENKRIKFENILKEVFYDYDYDYANYYGTEGEKIYSYIKDDLETENVFPKLIYYSKGKIIKETVASQKEQFEEFKTEIEKLS